MIEAKDVSKWFDGQRILYDISATFESGKTNLIIGKSGSGKTVFMKCLIGLFTPEQGEIFYDGRPLSRMDGKQRRETVRLIKGLCSYYDNGNCLYLDRGEAVTCPPEQFLFRLLQVLPPCAAERSGRERIGSWDFPAGGVETVRRLRQQKAAYARRKRAERGKVEAEKGR